MLSPNRSGDETCVPSAIAPALAAAAADLLLVDLEGVPIGHLEL